MSRGSKRAPAPRGGFEIRRVRQRLAEDGQQRPRCPAAGNKVSYPTEELAREALVVLRLRASSSPMRPEQVQKCDAGDHWHLTGGERAKCALTGTSIYLDREDALRGLALAAQRISDNPPTEISECGAHYHVVSPQRPRCSHNNKVIFETRVSAERALDRITRNGSGDIKPTRVEDCPFGEDHYHLARRPIR